MKKSRYRFISLLLLLLAFGLRLHYLDVQSLWYDEGVTARVSQMPWAEMLRWTADDIQPPLYYLLLGGWLRVFHPWAGSIAWLMRFFSAAFGFLLLPLLASLARKLWDDCAGLLTLFVAAVSPLMTYYSQEARMYALLLFWVTLAAWWVTALLAWRRTARPVRYLALYALTGLAALYTHYFAGLALLALALYWGHVWLREGRDRRALQGFVLANAAILLGYAPWLPAMLHRLRADSSYWRGRLKLGEALTHWALNFTVGAVEIFGEKAARAWLPWFGGAALLWLAGLILWRRRGRQRPLALLLHWLLLPALLILLLAWRTPKFNPRYLLIGWPAWALLVGGGGSAALWRPGRWLKSHTRVLRPAVQLLAIATLLLVTITSATGLDNLYHNPNFAKSAWRESIAYMFHNRQADEAALLVSGHAYPVFDVYLPPDAPPQFQVPRYRLPEIEILDVNEVLGWQESARALNADLAPYGGVWLFLWQDEVVDPAHVVTTQLGRYAQEQPAPPFAFIGLRHYRLPVGFHVPAQPPITLPGVALAAGLDLVGAEPVSGGVWLYWRARHEALPDIKVSITLQKGEEVLFSQDQRPVGYNFPTTRWRPGAIYPLWLPVEGKLNGARLRIHAYEAETGVGLGDFEATLP